MTAVDETWRVLVYQMAICEMARTAERTAAADARDAEMRLDRLCANPQMPGVIAAHNEWMAALDQHTQTQRALVAAEDRVEKAREAHRAAGQCVPPP